MLKKLSQMKNLKLLNRKCFLIFLLSFFISLNVQSQEPIDIWSIEEKSNTNKVLNTKNDDDKEIPQNSIYEMQSQSNSELSIEQSQTLVSKEVKLVGLYDPEENGLDINMWSNSNGDQILNIFKRIDKLNLSQDASEIMDILLLTNAYYPKQNITEEQFLEIKSNWLIKKSNYQLIESYLLKNQIINENSKLTKYLVDYYLSESNVKKACEIFSEIKDSIEDVYLSKFNIYCLIHNNKKEEAQLLIDLKKELNDFNDKFFEKKINYLMGYTNEPDTEISENTILNFHLSHITNPDFKFEPKNSTAKEIWRYLSTSNLLYKINDIEINELDKIANIEKATHDGNYSEKELFELYKRFQFTINQLLNIKESTKALPAIEARALIYQGILITTNIEKKLELMNALKNSFKIDEIEDAFSDELRNLLSDIDEQEVPSNYTTFYQNYIDKKENKLSNIKINNKILHQSKLINHFILENGLSDINKDVNNLLKKIKKDKKYFFSKKDIILIESLKSDGVKVLDKFNTLYEPNDYEMPSDIQIFINSGDMAATILRVIEVIGRDELKNIDYDSIVFYN
jgi:hypothetical protein